MCIRDSSWKPPDVNIRGVTGGTSSPLGIMDVLERFPLSDGTVIEAVCRKAVCIEQAPHDIVAPSTLDFCEWDGWLPDGRRVVIENHGFMVVPRVSSGSSTHSLLGKSPEVCTTESSEAPLLSVSDAAPLPPAPSAKGMLHWFAGRKRGHGAVSSFYDRLSGLVCHDRDSANGIEGNLARDQVFDLDMGLIRSGDVNRAHYGVPCCIYSVSRFRRRNGVRPLVTLSSGPSGILGMTPTEHAFFAGHEILVQRTCESALELHARSGLFCIENPVRRNDPSGPWKRFNSGKFPEHFCLFQHPRVAHLARVTKAKVASFPYCYFEHELGPVCKSPQKYTSLMYLSLIHI